MLCCRGKQTSCFTEVKLGGYKAMTNFNIICESIFVVAPSQHNGSLPQMRHSEGSAALCVISQDKQACSGHGRLGSEIPCVIFFTCTETIGVPLSYARPATVETVEHKKFH